MISSGTIRTLSFIFLLFWFLFIACTTVDSSSSQLAPTPIPSPTTLQTSPSKNLTNSCVDRFDPGIDYFPEKASLTYARNLSIQYHKHYKIVTVLEPFPGGDSRSYMLVQCGTPVPEQVISSLDATLINIPIKTLFTGSTTHLPWLVTLGRVKALTGVPQTKFISSQSILNMIESYGNIVEYAPNYEIDVETVVEASPTILMTSGPAPSQAHDLLTTAGVNLVWNAEWLEYSPLGRAEWLKMMAVFFNLEAVAQSRFDIIAKDYNSLLQKAATIPNDQRPIVMTGLEFGGIYYAAGGNSNIAHLISDAGGDYIWSKDKGAASIETDLETQLVLGGAADFWINGGAFWDTLEDVANSDSRYTKFKPFQTGQIWTNNLAVNPAGANDYYEQGVSRPDLILADLISIFHPQLLPQHHFLFYKKLSDY